ncbi:hypothetical protein [Halalkalibacterium ligniniphilum]|uniref:hypothetical protein n=1 Tax=Halalkalibacterium ligniniphilum TaxID=1134413 RepID=UPI001266F2C9|nr:hypothetical protein [Halalkalibacterium ligniniphilum]
MIEVILDMAMLWLTVVLTLLLVTAFAHANVSRMGRSLRSTWRQYTLETMRQERLTAPLIRPLSVSYHPKVHSVKDKRSHDDAPPLFVCSKS